MKKFENLEIDNKAMNLLQLVNSFMLAIPDDDEYLRSTKGIMMQDAFVIAVKIVRD